MDINSIEELDAALTVLRRNGVTSASLGTVQVSFGPGPSPSEEPQETGPAISTETDLCPCGHPYHLHSRDAGCLEGCPIERCVLAEPKIE